MRTVALAALALLAALSGGAGAQNARSTTAEADEAWRSDLAAWRKRADEGLRRERGWLSIVGRWELAPGATTIGAGPSNTVTLPRGLAPESLGTVHVAEGKAKLVLAPGQMMQAIENGALMETFTERQLLDDRDTIEWVTGGRLSLQFVRRADGTFVMRAADRDAPVRNAFPGRVWYAPQAAYRVPARFVAKPGAKIPIVNVRGEVSDEAVAGELQFELGGRTLRLDALDDDGNLFVIFRDATSGDTTYPPGRFLYLRKPADGRWVVDFNRAYNPPCAFSAYTTCPLPPPQNWLDIAVPAGERYVERKS
jgi:uncharacterized protein (DUF1684 family)